MAERPDAGDEAGVTAVEYGLLAGLIGAAVVFAGPALAEGFGALLDAVLGRMLS